MKFNVFVTLKKGALGLLTGLAAAVVLAIVQGLTSYNPVICSGDVVDNCTPKFLATAYLAIVPMVTGGLVAFANWLKNRGNA